MKNLKDTVRFVQNPPHLEQILETGDEAVIDCPIYQLEANKANLNEWFRQRGIHMETNGLLVLANPNTKVKDAPHDFPIIYKKQLPFHLQSFQSVGRNLSSKEVQDITRKIHSEQQQFNPFPLCSYYHVNPNDLPTGLLCQYCHENLLSKLNQQ